MLQETTRLCGHACTGALCERMQQELESFNFLTDANLAEVTPYFTCRWVPAGDILWREGTLADQILFLVNGRLEATRELAFSDRQIVVGLFGRGAILGEASLFKDTPHATTATAKTDLELIVLPRNQFDLLVERHPDLGGKLMRSLLQAVTTRLRGAYDRLTAIF